MQSIVERTNILFWNVRLRIVMGWKSLGIDLPSGCGTTAVPAEGTCSGVKYETPGAGRFTVSMISGVGS